MSNDTDFLTQRIGEIQRHLEGLYSNSEAWPPGTIDMLGDTLHELDIAIQAMQTAEEEMRRQNEDLLTAIQEVELEKYRYESLFHFAPDGYLVTDMEGIIADANHAATVLLNLHREFLIGKPLQVFVPEHGRRSLRQRLLTLRETTEVQEWELFLRPRQCDPVEVHARVGVIHDQFGARNGLRWLLRDVTQRRQAEREIRQWSNQFDELVAKRTEHLVAQNKAKDRFMAVLSHELRTPLTALLGAVYALQYDTLPPQIGPLIEIIHRNAEVEARLIDDLLDLTRIVQGKLMLNLEVIDVREILNSACETCREEVERGGIALRVDFCDDGCYVMVDPARLQQVFWNLIKNAVKFTPSGGAITIETEVREGRLIARVRDTGIGIGEDILPHIFDAFEQGGAAVTQRFGGLGLGLAISKGLVEMQNGTISAASAGQYSGSTFTVELPLVDPPARASESADVGKSNSPEYDKHILLVEDHIDTSKVVSLLLRQRGYHVRTVHSMTSAIEAARQERFDLVISDIGLPDGSGLDVIRKLHSMMPVKGIALSGYGMEEDIRRSREAGFAEHLVKPISSHKLLNAVERLVAAEDEGKL
jgi:PAS domain S-box-containing protein